MRSQVKIGVRSGSQRGDLSCASAPAGYECVPYYQCHNGTVLTDGSGLIDIRNGSSESLEDRSCPGFLEVCCYNPTLVNKERFIYPEK